MRYRMEDANGDYTFGLGLANFHVNSPAAVALAIKTRLMLWQGQYFADKTAGVPWDTQVIGFNPASLYDAIIKDEIAATPGYASLVSYSSSVNAARGLSITALVDTIYSGKATVAVTLPASGFGFGIGPYGENPFGE
jgi:hypothetical protein